MEPSRVVVGAVVTLLLACGDSGAAAPDDAGTDSTGPPATGSDTGPADETGRGTAAIDDSGDTGAFTGRLVVTADWLAGTLSLLDHAALVDGAATRDEMLVGTVDLSAYAPGPLQVEIVPDGRTAVVSISPGFFDGVVGTAIGAPPPAADGRLLVVDLVERRVLAELEPAQVPMGIAIAPDGARAYTANYGLADAPGQTLSVIDLEALSVVEDIVVGGRPEQVALDEAGALGLLNLASDGTVRAFQTADPAGTLSEPLLIGGDPSDVAFVPGTTLAVVSNSLEPSTYAIVDLADPAAPTLVEEAAPPGGVPYPVTAIPDTTEVVVAFTTFGAVNVHRIDASTTPATVVWSHQEPGVAAFPLGAAVDADAGLLLVDLPGASRLLVMGLDGTGARTIEWLPETGPTYVAIAPQ